MLRAILALLISFFALVQTEAQVVNGKTLVESRLVANTNVIEPGKPFQVGIHLKIADGWHTYWLNSGDSGIPPTLDWKLPPGWKVGEIQWPLPDKHIEPGDIVTYGYEGETMFLVELTPPEELPPGRTELKVDAHWLVCEQSCVPGSASLSLTLPAADGAEHHPLSKEDAALFTKFTALLPKTSPPPFAFRWEPHDTEVYLKVEGVPAGVALEFFPITQILRHPEPLSPTSFRIPYPEPPEAAEVEGLLIATTEETGVREAWTLRHSNEKGSNTAAAKPAASPSSGGAALAAQGESLTLSKAILLGFAGGFILNLMPCVLPVIALKIFGFIGQVGESRQRVFRLGMAFVAGIFVWFLLLALLVIAARTAGREITWAFQFQNPQFVLGMAVLVFVFALNLLGVFEIWLPGTAKLAAASDKKGYSGAFFHGIFATLLATPCTAPFLGPALAFTFAQSAPTTLLMFMAIAAGMSFPYVLLTAQPAWMRFLPRPGDWMVRLKQAMGFLLLGTVAWLFGILVSHDGARASGAAWLFVGIGAACWVFGNWVQPSVARGRQAVALVSIVGILFFGAFMGRTEEAPLSGEWEPWSPERVEALVKEGKPIFVDFTADWCVNCKYNEKFVLDAKGVKEAFKGVVTLKADWTKGDPRITAELKKLGRAGVPVYAVYPANDTGEAAPKVLPEMLTQKLVIDALEEAKAQ